jgi:TetR/AcrR family transcriptional repressor of nem operon
MSMRVTRQQAAENRKRVLEVAGRLFREKGFDGVGVADVMQAAGLTHGGFYGQFESKDDLAAQALGGTLGEAAERWRARAAATPDDPFGAIVGYYLSRGHRDIMGAGCPISALSGEVTRQSPAVRASFTEGFEKLADVLAENLPEDAVARSEDERRQKALAVLATIAGAVTLARAVDDRQLSDEILEAVRSSLGLNSKTPSAGR